MFKGFKTLVMKRAGCHDFLRHMASKEIGHSIVHLVSLFRILSSFRLDNLFVNFSQLHEVEVGLLLGTYHIDYLLLVHDQIKSSIANQNPNES